VPDQPEVRDPKDPKVRPRLVWSGIGLAVVALAVSGVAMMAGLHWLTWTSGVMVAVGLLLAWRGGVEYDTRGQEPPHHELEEVLEGGTHAGISPLSHVVGDEVQQTAARSSARTEHLLDRATGGPWRELRTLGAFGLVAVGVWLLVGTAFLGYPFTVVGQDGALRDVGFAVVLTLAGLRLRLPRRSLTTTIVCLLGGALLVFSGLALPHDSTTVRWNELLCGCATLVLASLTFSRARPSTVTGG
jgi:hypothetical protein